MIDSESGERLHEVHAAHVAFDGGFEDFVEISLAAELFWGYF